MWQHLLLRPLLLSTTLLTFFPSFGSLLYTLFALRTLRLSPGTLGLVIDCGGIGALAGALAGAAFLMASQLLGGGLLAICVITENSLRQQAVAAVALGRAAAVWKMASSIIVPIGMMLGALLAEHADMRGAM